MYATTSLGYVPFPEIAETFSHIRGSMFWSVFKKKKSSSIFSLSSRFGSDFKITIIVIITVVASGVTVVLYVCCWHVD